MTDNLTPIARRRTMSAVKSANSKAEMTLRRMLHGQGFRFRLHDAALPGTPDLALPARKAIIFMHGCFWHGHQCKARRRPATHRDYWTKKILRNRQRDRATARLLLSMGWRVAVVWECALAGPRRLPEGTLARRLAAWLRGKRRELDLGGLPMSRFRPRARHKRRQQQPQEASRA
jgi:DNA mismatch endonuclease (patch repair protein)